MKNGTLRIGVIAVAATVVFGWLNKKTLKLPLKPYA